MSDVLDEGFRLLKARYDLFVKNNGKYVLCLMGKDGNSHVAYLDPVKIHGAFVDDKGAYILYYSKHPFYDRFDYADKYRGRIKEDDLVDFKDVFCETKRVKPCNKGYRAWLPEFDKWDDDCYDLCTVFYFLKTDIHPKWGLMD